jgi:hypothetical protein
VNDFCCATSGGIQCCKRIIQNWRNQMEERIMRTLTTIAATLGVVGAIAVGSAAPAAAWGYGYYHHPYYHHHYGYYPHHRHFYGYYPTTTTIIIGTAGTAGTSAGGRPQTAKPPALCRRPAALPSSPIVPHVHTASLGIGTDNAGAVLPRSRPAQFIDDEGWFVAQRNLR